MLVASEKTPTVSTASHLTTRLLQPAGLDASATAPLDHYWSARVADHFLRVTYGLESMLLGETEILARVAAAEETTISQHARLHCLAERFRRWK